MDGLLGEEGRRGHPHLDITSRAFQSKKYIQRVIANVTYAIFEGRLVDEVGEAEEHTGEALKQLIRDNLGVFIDSKDAMDTVYQTDTELFTGEALDHITSSFEGASMRCESLVKPITETYLEMQRARKSSEMLNRFFSVLSVPGAIYESCGVRVAQRRQRAAAMGVKEDDSTSSTADDDDDVSPVPGDADMGVRTHARGGPPQKASGRAMRRAAPCNDNGDEGGMEEEEEDEDEDEDEVEEGDGDRDGTAADASTVRVLGTLEIPADSTAAADMYRVSAGEEIYFWCDTPLVRLADFRARRQHIEHVANYEAAVLHLRRAMLYIEETYSLIDGTTLAGDDGESSKTAQVSPSPGEGRRLSVGQDAFTTSAAVGDAAKPSLSLSSVGRSFFAKQFSMALLRASLYLCNQLAEELVYADPADTVLIEDTLSMMMDASIASVKLHHFCGVLHETLGDRDGHGQVLTKLRTQLSTSRTAAEALIPMAGGVTATTAGSVPRAHAALRTEGAGEHFLSASPNRSMAEAGKGGAAAFAAPPRTSPRRDTATYQHPAQFFISVVQRQQKHIFYSSAAAILREAEGWLWKAQTEAARGLKERQRKQELRVPATGDEHAGEGTAEDHAGKGGFHEYTLLSNSFVGTGFGGDSGFIGNVNDSFLQDSSWTKTDTLGATGKRHLSADSPTTGDGRGVAGTGGRTTDEGRKSGSFVPDANMWKVLDAFNTPESPFPTNTEFCLGTSDMEAVLVASCQQIRMHSSFLLTQLFTRADVEAVVMAQAGHLDTFALRLCSECVGTLEHVVSSYWGGIATTIHSGAFDFAPEVGSPLYVILAQLIDRTGAKASAAAGGAAAVGSGSGDNTFQRLPSTIPNGVHSRTMSRTWETGDGDGPSGPEGAASSSAVVREAATDQLPAIRFIPALPHAFRTAAANGGETPAAEQLSASMRLRDISVQAVHRMISGAITTLQALFLAYINRSVVDGFVSTLAQYQTSDLRLHSRTERIELHAAILYEIILAQWERMMSVVSGAVLRLKIVVGESSNSSTVTSETQVKEIEDLLQELELLRTTSLRCYLHGVGVLSKAYLMALPLLKGHTDTSLDARVRTRLSRESVSSNAVHQLLNLLSVVMDRCVSFFMRDKEVYDSVDLFAVKSESLGNDADEDAGRNTRSGYGVRDDAVRRRGRLLLRRRLGDGSSGDKGHGNGLHAAHDGQGAEPPAPTSPGDGIDTFVDPVSELIAQFHSRLVMESLQDHEELLLALLSHLLLAFVDMQHMKSCTLMRDVTLHPDQRERCVVECMADTLCLATTLTPILMENLLMPCLFEVIARQLPVLCATPADVAVMLQSKQQQYIHVYLSVVEEHSQLAVDAMMNTYLAVTEQPITDLIRRQGFMQPLFDWQRISPQTAAAVRPYIADAIACIARAHETLNVIRQPVLSSAATQRLVAHLVRTFVASVTSDVNVFELSVECSSSFLVHGLTLLGAEATTILRFVDSVVAHVAAKPTTNELMPELAMARENLSALTQMLDSFTASVCEAIVTARNLEGGNTSSEFIALVFLSRDKRQERREGMVQAAMHTLRYMLDAINTELEESSLSSAALLQLHSVADAGTKGDSAGSGDSRSAVAERIVQRIEQRKRGYELRRSRAAATAQGKADSQDVEKRRAVQERSMQKKVPEDDADPSGGLDGVASAGSRRQQLRRTLDAQRQSSTSTGQHGDSGDAQAGGGFSPRTPQESERESWRAAEEVGNVYQLAQGQRQRQRVRRTRRAGVANSVDASDEAVVGLGAAAAAARPVSPTPAAFAGTLPSASLADSAAAGNEDSAEAPLGRVPRRARRRVVSGGGSGGGDGDDDGGADGAVTRHERRARRFGRTNVLQ